MMKISLSMKQYYNLLGILGVLGILSVSFASESSDEEEHFIGTNGEYVPITEVTPLSNYNGSSFVQDELCDPLCCILF